jgi:lysophospholipase L1-like esterase
MLTLPNTTINNVAVSSETLATDMLSQQLAQVNSCYATGYANDAVILMAGLNDYNAARTGAQFWADMQTWITSSLAANPSRKIIVCTTPKGANITAGEETERVAGNVLVVAGWAAAGAHALCDVNALLPEATGDTSIFNDGTHWTTVACQRVATAVQSALAGFGFT